MYFSCSSYPGFINIINVEYTEKNTYVCNNHKKDSVHKKDLCKATQDEKDCLACVFMRVCDGKVNCNLHVAHGTYNGINLPCRNLSMDIRIEVIYDCIKCKLIVNAAEEDSHMEMTRVLAVSFRWQNV